MLFSCTFDVSSALLLSICMNETKIDLLIWLTCLLFIILPAWLLFQMLGAKYCLLLAWPCLLDWQTTLNKSTSLQIEIFKTVLNLPSNQLLYLRSIIGLTIKFKELWLALLDIFSEETINFVELLLSTIIQ